MGVTGALALLGGGGAGGGALYLLMGTHQSVADAAGWCGARTRLGGVVDAGWPDLRSCQGWTSQRWHASAQTTWGKLLRSQHWGRVNGGDCSFFVGLVTTAGW